MRFGSVRFGSIVLFLNRVDGFRNDRPNEHDGLPVCGSSALSLSLFVHSVVVSCIISVLSSPFGRSESEPESGPTPYVSAPFVATRD